MGRLRPFAAWSQAPIFHAWYASSHSVALQSEFVLEKQSKSQHVLEMHQVEPNACMAQRSGGIPWLCPEEPWDSPAKPCDTWISDICIDKGQACGDSLGVDCSVDERGEAQWHSCFSRDVLDQHELLGLHDRLITL